MGTSEDLDASQFVDSGLVRSELYHTICPCSLPVDSCLSGEPCFRAAHRSLLSGVSLHGFKEASGHKENESQ